MHQDLSLFFREAFRPNKLSIVVKSVVHLVHYTSLRIFGRDLLSIVSLLACCALFFCSPPAWADAGVPMLLFVWPSSWLLLLAIVPIEAAVAVRLLKISWKRSLTMSGAANLVSTIVGIPVTWILLVVLEMVSGGGRAYGLDTLWKRVYAVTVQSPWLIPYDVGSDWMVPSAAAVLCVPFFFMSVAVEAFCATKFTKDKPLAWRWSWMANGITYVCIVIGLLTTLAVQLLRKH
jgi:hypothetical protein